MKFSAKILFLGLTVCAINTLVWADDCENGQISQCFVDGTNTKCVCIDPPVEVPTNPPAEDDGFDNPEGGGQEEE